MAQKKGYNTFNISHEEQGEAHQLELCHGQECHWLILSLNLYSKVLQSMELFVR